MVKHLWKANQTQCEILICNQYEKNSNSDKNMYFINSYFNS